MILPLGQYATEPDLLDSVVNSGVSPFGVFVLRFMQQARKEPA